MVLSGLRAHVITHTQPVRCRQTRLGCIFWALWVHVTWTNHPSLMLKNHLPADMVISPWCMGRLFIWAGASTVSFVWVSTLNRTDHSDFDLLQLQVLQSLCSRVGLVIQWPLSQHEKGCHEELDNLPRVAWESQVSPLRQVLTLWWWKSQGCFWTIPPWRAFFSLCTIPNILWNLRMLNDWFPGVGLLLADGFLGILPRMILQDQWCSCPITGPASDVAVLLQTFC